MVGQNTKSLVSIRLKASLRLELFSHSVPQLRGKLQRSHKYAFQLRSVVNRIERLT
jgi:hypothetical protein